MAYGEKYRFCTESQNGSEIKVLILQDGYTGQVYDRPMGRSPLLRRENNGKILGSSFELYAECLVDAEYAELYTSSAREFKVEVYKDETVIWFGFITPELYSEPDIAPPYDVQIVATDGLGELKNYEFLSSGPESLYSHLVNLLQYTGLNLEFLIASTLQYIDGDGAESGQNSLLNFQIDLSHHEGENCYDVLQVLLDSLNARIMIYDGQWLVYRETDLVHLASGTGLSVYDANGLYKTLDIASFGSMTSCQWWPVGQLSSVVVPANNRLSIEAPNHYKSNILDDSAWTVENSASYDSAEGAYILPDEGSNIVQKIEFGRELGSRLRLSILARNVGSGEEDQPIGIEVLIDGRSYAGARQYWLVQTADSDRGIGAYVWKTTEGQIEGGLAVPSDSDTSEDAQEIEIILPLYANNSRSYFYASSVQVRLFNPAGTHDIYVYDCRLSLYSQKQGWKTDALIDNQAREDAGTIEVTMVDSSTALSTAEIIMTGVPLDPQGRIIQNWKIGADPEGSYLTVLTEDYAMAVALPRMKYTGTLNVPAGHIPSLFLRDGRFYSLTSYSYDMLNDEVEVELLSIPVADVEVTQEILPMISASGGSSSGSSGGSGGGIGSGGGLSFWDIFYLTEDRQSIGTKYNLFSERELSGHGLHLGNDEGVTSSLAGLIDVDLSDPANGDVLVFNGVHWTNVKQSDLVPDVDLSNYYTRQEVDNKIKTIDLSAYLKSDDAANTYAKLSDYNALKSNFDTLYKTLNDDTTGVINTWQEVVDFVNEYSGSEDLATILGKMNADISNRLLASDFTDFKKNEYDKLAEAVAGHTRNITELTQRVGVAEGNINKLLGWFGEDENGDIYVKGDKNFYATKEVSSHGLHLGSGGAGLINSVLDSDQLGSNLTSDNTVVFNAYATNHVWSKVVENAGQIVSLTTRVSTLESKATKVSVTQALTSGTKIGSIAVDGKATELYAPTIPSLSGGSAAEDGKYVSGVTVSGHTVTVTKATLGLGSLAYKSALSASDIPSLDWSKITSGKPTTISGYGITDAYTMSSVDSMLSRYLPIAGGTLSGNLTVNGTALFKNNLTSEGNVIGAGGIICKYDDYQIELNYYASGNRGLFDSATDAWLIYTNGTNTYLPAKDVQIAKNLIVSGRVGLGTDLPQYRLDVVGNVGASGFILANKVYATSNIGIGTDSPIAKLEIADGRMLIRNATSIDAITINNTNESKGYQVIRFERNGTDYAALQWYHDGFGSYTWNAVSCLNLDTAAAGGYVTIGHWGNPALMVNCDTSEVNITGNLTVNGTALFKNNLTSEGNVIGAGGIICKYDDYQIELNYYASGNRGLFDSATDAWLIYTNGTNTYLPAKDVQIAKNLIVSGSITIGDAELVWDGKALKISTSVYSEGEVSSRGLNLDSDIVAGEYLPIAGGTLSGNLTVDGTLTATSYISAPYYYKSDEFYFGSGSAGVGASGALIYSYNSNPIYFYTSGALRMSIDGAGQVGVAGPMTIANTLTIGTTTLTDTTWNLTISKELNLLGGGTATDISSGIAAAFKTNRAQINTLIIDSILLGADGSHKASTRSFKISKYGSVTSQAPSSITTLLEVSTAGNVSVVGSVSQGSDIRRKAVMEDKILSLDDMANAPLFTFVWNDRSDSTVHLGTSAQYWENVTPWLVSGVDLKGIDCASLGVAMGISLARKMLSLEDRVRILELENN